MACCGSPLHWRLSGPKGVNLHRLSLPEAVGLVGVGGRGQHERHAGEGLGAARGACGRRTGGSTRGMQERGCGACGRGMQEKDWGQYEGHAREGLRGNMRGMRERGWGQHEGLRCRDVLNAPSHTRSSLDPLNAVQPTHAGCVHAWPQLSSCDDYIRRCK